MNLKPALDGAFDAAHDATEHARQVRLSRFNARRLKPAFPDDLERAPDLRGLLSSDLDDHAEEIAYVEAERAAVVDRAREAPQDPDAFVAWFEGLRATGPGQGDRLFPWLAKHATREEMQWFVLQEVAGEAGFDDLVALAQVRMPTIPKLEMARNYWDEMGRGHERGMHGPMLGRTARELDVAPTHEETVWESLALANVMAALAANRPYAYHAVGALGVVELTAPGRVALVNEGLKRLGVSQAGRQYFQLHAGLDIRHSEAWNREVLRPLVADDPRTARAMAEGALMRLACGARCFARYRRELGVA